MDVFKEYRYKFCVTVLDDIDFEFHEDNVLVGPSSILGSGAPDIKDQSETNGKGIQLDIKDKEIYDKLLDELKSYECSTVKISTHIGTLVKTIGIKDEYKAKYEDLMLSNEDYLYEYPDYIHKLKYCKPECILTEEAPDYTKCQITVLYIEDGTFDKLIDTYIFNMNMYIGDVIGNLNSMPNTYNDIIRFSQMHSWYKHFGEGRLNYPVLFTGQEPCQNIPGQEKYTDDNEDNYHWRIIPEHALDTYDCKIGDLYIGPVPKELKLVMKRFPVVLDRYFGSRHPDSSRQIEECERVCVNFWKYIPDLYIEN